MNHPTHHRASPLGGLFQDRRHLRADLRMVSHAIAQGWPIPSETWSVVVQQLGEILGDDSDRSFMRARIAALETILSVKRSHAERAIRIFQDRARSGATERP